ncbi:endonuclease IV [Natranaerovirga pectinivora]|uniref:Probable endonuclease 4 n=1 Tax=Natranaerovirga pectinivora TaxID=682400 RepID=A0A4R3MK51_9FIRM|nr:deoxyribonuclease IV [Natranaerovirga pectinivora]TCT14104.1 endonuclease IV [Natranaerovirga pectinivora]
MIKIGSHVSISGGLIKAAQEALSYDSNTFMVYTGAPQNTKRKDITDLKIQEGHAFMKSHNLSDIVVHAPYIVNLASYQDDIFELAIRFLGEEIERTTALGANYIVVHPGSYTKKDLDYGIDRIAEGLNNVLDTTTKPYVLLETMSGKGSEVGFRFEQLERIISKVTHNDKIGVCFDTCHTHDSGYDIVNDFDGVINEFDKIIGLEKLKVFHLNGSLNPIGAKKDRHANIGADGNNPKGKDYIGFDAIYNIVHHEVAKDKPLILETPWISKTQNLYKEEIHLLRGDTNE